MSSLLRAGMTGVTLPGTGNNKKKRILKLSNSAVLSEKKNTKTIFFFFFCSEVLFGEYNCTGKGADRTGRVPWSKSLTQDEAKPFLGMEFISGDQWLRL